MNNHGKYNTNKTVSIALRVILIALIAFAVWAFSTASAVKDWDAEYPMVNQQVEWTGAGFSFQRGVKGHG